MSTLIEHYAGLFPFWLSPVQVRVLPVIEEKHASYAEKICSELKAAGIRAELDSSNDGLGKKVRNTKVEKVPYWLVIGDKEIEANNVTLESRDAGNLGAQSIQEVLKKFQSEIGEKK